MLPALTRAGHKYRDLRVYEQTQTQMGMLWRNRGVLYFNISMSKSNHDNETKFKEENFIWSVKKESHLFIQFLVPFFFFFLHISTTDSKLDILAVHKVGYLLLQCMIIS